MAEVGVEGTAEGLALGAPSWAALVEASKGERE